jgi:hypothetical protein
MVVPTATVIFGRWEFHKEILSSRVKHRIASRPSPVKSAAMKMAEGVWQFVSDPENVESMKNSIATLNVVIRNPPIDP